MSLLNIYRRGVMLLDWFIIRFYIRKFQVVGRERVPPEGPLIVVSNHLNNLDPLMIAAALPRHPSFMMKKEMLWWPILGIGARLFGSFTVDREGGDLKAIRTATEWVRRGDALVMFPEGRRSRTGGITPPHPGTGLLALRTEATILPVAIIGTETTPWPWFIFMPLAIKRVHITIGEPFRLPSVRRINSETATEATDTIMRHIAALLPPQYRGIYADVESEPEREVPAEAKEYTKR